MMLVLHKGEIYKLASNPSQMLLWASYHVYYTLFFYKRILNIQKVISHRYTLPEAQSKNPLQDFLLTARFL